MQFTTSSKWFSCKQTHSRHMSRGVRWSSINVNVRWWPFPLGLIIRRCVVCVCLSLFLISSKYPLFLCFLLYGRYFRRGVSFLQTALLLYANSFSTSHTHTILFFLSTFFYSCSFTRLISRKYLVATDPSTERRKFIMRSSTVFVNWRARNNALLNGSWTQIARCHSRARLSG